MKSTATCCLNRNEMYTCANLQKCTAFPQIVVDIIFLLRWNTKHIWWDYSILPHHSSTTRTTSALKLRTTTSMVSHEFIRLQPTPSERSDVVKLWKTHSLSRLEPEIISLMIPCGVDCAKMREYASLSRRTIRALYEAGVEMSFVSECLIRWWLRKLLRGFGVTRRFISSVNEVAVSSPLNECLWARCLKLTNTPHMHKSEVSRIVPMAL